MSTVNPTPKPRRTRGKSKRPKVVCASCHGRGRVAVPQMDGVTMSKLAKAAGRSRSLVSRMLSDGVAAGQKRVNPSLDTLLALRDAVREVTGTPLSLDALAKAIRG